MLSVPAISKCHFGAETKDGNMVFLELAVHLPQQSPIDHSTIRKVLFLNTVFYWCFYLFACLVTILTYCKFHGSQDTTEEEFLSYRKTENPSSSEVEELERRDCNNWSDVSMPVGLVLNLWGHVVGNDQKVSGKSREERLFLTLQNPRKMSSLLGNFYV